MTDDLVPRLYTAIDETEQRNPLITGRGAKSPIAVARRDIRRMCQAHREIVDDAKSAWDRRDKSPSWYLKATALHGVLLWLAEGYGLTTEDGQ